MRAIRGGICVLVAFAVLAHGAVEPWSEAVLEVGAAVLLLVWVCNRAAGQRIRVDLESSIVAAVGVLGGGGGAMGGGHHRGSVLDSHRTSQVFRAAGAVFSLCAVLSDTCRTGTDSSGSCSFLDSGCRYSRILQHFTFNGKLYWVRELRYGGIPFGPYVNRNHFAGLMELLIPPGLAILILGGERRDQLPLVTLFTLLPIGASVSFCLARAAS